MTVTNPQRQSITQKLHIKSQDTTECKLFFLGFDSEDKSGFTKNRVPLVSSHTNPVFLKKDGTPTGLTMKITGESSGNITLKFFESYDPYDITENTTWDGQIFLDQTANVDNNSTLTILPGTTVYLADNVSLIIRPGAKLIAEGTQSEPIEFVRMDSGQDWNRVSLLSSSGNSIEWALFDGGYINLSIASKNNTISHSTFRNATYRTLQGWHNQDGSGNAGATISYSLIENSATVGFVAQYIDLDLSYTTIQNNGQAGLYVYSGTVYPFHNDLIIDNGVTSTSRDGIEVKSSGTLYMHGDNMSSGYNKVTDNSDDQISNYGDLIIAVSGGLNYIGGNYGSGKYLVGNYSSATVDADYNYWGQSGPTTSMFYGSVDWYNFMSSYYPFVHGYDGQAPAKALPGQGSEPMTNQDIAAAYTDAKSKLGQAKTAQEVRDEIYALYKWAGLSGDIALKSQFNKFIKKIIHQEVAIYSANDKNKVMKDYGAILYAKSLIRDEQYEQAQEWLKADNFDRVEGTDKRDWLELSIATQIYHDNYQKALNTIHDLYAFEESRGTDMEEFKASYSTIEGDIKRRIGERNQDPANQTKEFSAKTTGDEFRLQAYPNPFNPTTNIKFTLPNKAAVSLVIYDMLGRKVTTLVEGELPAGEQTFRFDASNLANGMYLYELRTANQVIVKKMTLIK